MMGHDGFRIAIIGVSYKTDIECERFLDSVLRACAGGQVDVFVVNNSASGDSDKTLSHLLAKGAAAIFNAPTNPGYFGGARLALSKFDPLEYNAVIVSNVDLVVDDKQLDENLKKYLELKDVGMLAPSVISELSGIDSNPFMNSRPSNGRMAFYRWVFSNYLTGQLYSILGLLKAYWNRSRRKTIERIGEARKIYAPHGSFLVFTKEYFCRGGDLNFPAYMYGEEVFVAERCRSLGLQVLYIPEFKVKHKERASTGLFYSMSVLRWKRDSSRYLFREYFG